MKYFVNGRDYEFDSAEDLKDWASGMAGTDEAVEINSIEDENGNEYALEWTVNLVRND